MQAAFQNRFEIPTVHNCDLGPLGMPSKLLCTASIRGHDEVAMVNSFRSASVAQALAMVLRNFLEFDDDWMIPYEFRKMKKCHPL